MKQYPVAVRFSCARVIAGLVGADRALEQARQSLIAADLELARTAGIPDEQRAEIAAEIQRMRSILFADEVTVKDHGSALAWDLASLVLAVGAAAEGAES